MRGPCSDLVPRRSAPACVQTLVPQRPVVGAARPRRRQPTAPPTWVSGRTSSPPGKRRASARPGRSTRSWSGPSLGPQRPAHLARAPGRQHEELERQLEGRQRARRVHRRDRRRDLGVGRRLEVANGQVVRAKHRPEPVARVIGAMLRRDGSLEHGADALAQPPRGLRLACQMGSRISSTSATDTSKTGRWPMCGRT